MPEPRPTRPLLRTLTLLVAGALATPVLAASPAPAVTAPSTTTPSSSAAADPVKLRVGTYNIRAGVPMDGFTTSINAFKPTVDVAGLQEIGSNERNRYLRDDENWGYYRPPALQQNPIIWNRALFDFLDGDGYKIAAQRYLGSEYTGGVKGDSWATIVRLRHRASGQTISFVNVHLVRGAVKGGRPAAGRPRMFDLYTDEVAGTLRAVNAERAVSDRVYVLGDFNAGFVADNKWRLRKLPFRKFKTIGFQSMWQGSPYVSKPVGTHNDALIDQVWNPANPVTETIGYQVGSSDHWPVVATYELPAPADGYQPVEGTVGFGDVTVVPNGNRAGDTEADGPSKLPSMFIDLQGDVRHGYAQVRVEEETASRSFDGNSPGDFTVDTASVFDNDFTNDAVSVDIVSDDVCEPDETFTLHLVDPVNTRILPGTSSVRVTLRDDDCR